jgi:hypothetical protein
MRAVLIYYEKRELFNRYVIEMTIHDVGQSIRYPVGIKYGLFFFDFDTGKKVLFDNHHPKGPHIHLDQKELPYSYSNDERLIEDFKASVLEHTGVVL